MYGIVIVITQGVKWYDAHSIKFIGTCPVPGDIVFDGIACSGDSAGPRCGAYDVHEFCSRVGD